MRFALLVSLVIATGAYSLEENCRSLYTNVGGLPASPVPEAFFQPHLGKRTGETDEYVVYRLGNGQTGAVVFRHVPKDANKKTSLHKEYDPFLLARREADLALFERLDEVCDESDGFGVVKATPYTIAYPRFQVRLEMDDIAGRDLHGLLLDPKVSEPFEAALRKAYAKNLEILATRVRERLGLASEIKSAQEIHFSDETLDGTNVLSATLTSRAKRNPVALLVKSDNVIVHYDSPIENIRMTIVDPH